MSSGSGSGSSSPSPSAWQQLQQQWTRKANIIQDECRVAYESGIVGERIDEGVELVKQLLQPTHATAIAVGCASGLLSFFCCHHAWVFASKVCRISSNQRIRATVTGTCGVLVSGAAAGHMFVSTSTWYAREKQHLRTYPFNHKTSAFPFLSFSSLSLSSSSSSLWSSSSSSSSSSSWSSSWSFSFLSSLFYDSNFSSSSLLCAESSIYGITSLLIFIAAGGRLRGWAPSDVAKIGTFATKQGRIPAPGKDYADTTTRKALTVSGRRDGCHHCGQRRVAVSALANLSLAASRVSSRIKSVLFAPFRMLLKPFSSSSSSPSSSSFATSAAAAADPFPNLFIGDHMPPNKYVRAGQKQMYYPQCPTCSNIQAHAVRMDQRTLVHPRTFRRYHIWFPIPPLVWLLLFPLIDYIQQRVRRRETQNNNKIT